MHRPIHAIIIVLLFGLIGCGYRFSGGGTLPGGIVSVCLPVFENRSSETGIGTALTNAVAYEFTRSGKVRLVECRQAQAQLFGAVKSVRVESIAHSGSQTAVERRVTLTVEIRLVGTDGTVLKPTIEISEKEAYPVSSDKSTSDREKRQAIAILSKRLAEKIYKRLTDDF